MPDEPNKPDLSAAIDTNSCNNLQAIARKQTIYPPSSFPRLGGKIASADKPRLTLRQGDITELGVDAIVNAANENLVMGGGVAGAIRSKGGPAIQDECDRIGHTPTGTAVITTGGRLKARHVIHAVGPVNGTGNEDEKLKNTVLSTLRVASDNDLRSVAFPAISAGIFGFPKQRCAEIMICTMLEYLAKNKKPEDIIIVLYDELTFTVFEKEYMKQNKN